MILQRAILGRSAGAMQTANARFGAAGSRIGYNGPVLGECHDIAATASYARAALAKRCSRSPASAPTGFRLATANDI